ncbi:hypothetical protein PGTUg99_019423 [Puccinia graminis f. sp. tritici]|uniref:Uncharacterized protein n=1 Tax=Puccinia graminis f. sp. tritici TaxID=56615 RepID=A0A5B0SKR7_PUCGR|nr:hypothetical protein PGTUg99_019423 [Puccinia graminis f. sp. tritici]
MDQYLYHAYNRIQLFLADLNFVLGLLPPAGPNPYRPLTGIHQVQFPQDFNLPTQCNLGSNTKTYTFRFPPNQQRANVYNRRKLNRPLNISHSASQVQPTCQHESLHYPDNPNDLANEYPSDRDNLVDENPADHNDLIEENPNDGNDLADDYYSNQVEANEPDDIDLDEIEWDDRSDLDINATPDSYQPDPSLTSDAIPEDYVDQFIPEANSIHQPEPDFDLKKLQR